MMKEKVLTVFVLAMALMGCVGCAPDPRDEADARRTEMLSVQEALDREQARNLRNAEAERRAEYDVATRERWSRIWDAASKGAATAATFSVFAIVLAGGVSVAILIVGLGEAGRDAAILRANLIPLNPATRQYPLLRQWVSADGRRLLTWGKGVWMLSNPNDGSVEALDERVEGNRQKIAGMVSAWDVGLVAAAARGANDSNSEGVSVVGPVAAQIINASWGAVPERK